MIPDLSALWREGWRLLTFRSGPEDLPYSPVLTMAMMAVAAILYVTWVVSVSTPESAPPALALLGPAGVALYAVVVLRLAGHWARWPQFGLAASIVHIGAAVLALGILPWLGSSATPAGGQATYSVVPTVLVAAVQLAGFLWYAILMCRIWASTLDRGIGMGIVMVVLQYLAYLGATILALIVHVSLSSPAPT